MLFSIYTQNMTKNLYIKYVKLYNMKGAVRMKSNSTSAVVNNFTNGNNL